MFHGRKRVDKVTLSEAEIKAIEDKLEKIGKNNRTLLAKRAAKEYTKETLEQTAKFSFLSPDFSTLWNYRREILEHLFKQETQPEIAPSDLDKQNLGIIIDELKFLVKGIMKSPKSYTLWF